MSVRTILLSSGILFASPLAAVAEMVTFEIDSAVSGLGIGGYVFHDRSSREFAEQTLGSSIAALSGQFDANIDTVNGAISMGAIPLLGSEQPFLLAPPISQPTPGQLGLVATFSPSDRDYVTIRNFTGSILPSTWNYLHGKLSPTIHGTSGVLSYASTMPILAGAQLDYPLLGDLTLNGMFSELTSLGNGEWKMTTLAQFNGLFFDVDINGVWVEVEVAIYSRIDARTVTVPEASSLLLIALTSGAICIVARRRFPRR